jgi:transposase-like protein
MCSAKGMMGGSNRVAIDPASSEAPRRRRVVEETVVPGVSVARLARAHGVNANQVFSWRRLHQRGRLGGTPCKAALLPVTIPDSMPSVKLVAEPESPQVQAQCLAPSVLTRARYDPAGTPERETAYRRRSRPGRTARGAGVPAGMITLPGGTQVWML